MRHLFIINPAAGKKDSTVKLEQRLQLLPFAHEVVYTKAAGDARHIARAAAESGRPVRIYACGGDGTLNEVVNGAAGYDNAAITCVPKGTGNDFLKIFGEEYRTLFYDLEELARGPQAAFDLIDCNGRLGIDVACVGVDARIAASVHRYKRWPLVSGKGAYILAMAENLLLRDVSRSMSVRMGDWEWTGKKVTLVCVCNGRYYGGGFMPMPEAVPDDGVLDALFVPGMRPQTFLTLVRKYARGQYRQLLDFVRPYHGDWVSVAAHREMVAVVDGEVLRDTAFTIRLSEKKVNFFFPAAAEYRVREREAAGQAMASG